jgi:hypothetical protein
MRAYGAADIGKGVVAMVMVFVERWCEGSKLALRFCSMYLTVDL